MNILLLDNYDSFTWNLYDYLVRSGAHVQVYRNDAITPDQVATMDPDGIVLSPGPGKPQDAGIMMALIEKMHHSHPILGICLGYQALGAFFGADVVHSPVPMHGKTSTIGHNGKGLFNGIPDPTEVMRYHSLNIDRIPPEIIITARTINTLEPMALEHCSLPLCGVQFHPESVLTKHGLAMVGNWLNSIH